TTASFPSRRGSDGHFGVRAAWNKPATSGRKNAGAGADVRWAKSVGTLCSLTRESSPDADAARKPDLGLTHWVHLTLAVLPTPLHPEHPPGRNSVNMSAAIGSTRYPRRSHLDLGSLPHQWLLRSRSPRFNTGRHCCGAQL